MEIRAKDCMKGMVKGRCRVDQLRAYLPLNESARRENSRDAVSGVQRRSSYTPATTRSYAPTLRGGGRATALRRE